MRSVYVNVFARDDNDNSDASARAGNCRYEWWRNLREVVEAAYGKGAILGIWAAYGSFRLTLQITPFFFVQISSL